MNDNTMTIVKTVTSIMPVRNEAPYIGKCLYSIISNDYPKDNFTLLVIDGRSTDQTREIVREYTQKYPYIHLLDNPKIIQTYGSNIGLRAAKSDFIIRMDAHVLYPRDFVSKLISWIQKSGADCVGGILITKPGRNTVIAKVNTMVLSHPFGIGNSYFRTGLKAPKYVDTVPFGCYRKEVFEKIGFFNENLDRTDDIEFNLRLMRSGGKILLVPEIISYYFARPTLWTLAKQSFSNGFWVLYSLAFVKMPFSIRHLVPLFFVLSLFGSLMFAFAYQPFFYLFALIAGFYLGVDTFVSLKLSLKKGLKYFPFLLVTFPVLHLSYGIGSIWGIIKPLIYYLKWKARKLRNK